MATTVEFQGEIVSEPVLPRDEALDRLREGTTVTDRGMDWRLALAIFTPALAAYVAIGYALHVAANALF